MINELIKIKKENPELEIVTLVSVDVCDGDHPYTVGSVSKIEKDWYYLGHEVIHRGESNIKDYLESLISDCGHFCFAPKNEIDDFIDRNFLKLKRNGAIKEVIYMFIDPE